MTTFKQDELPHHGAAKAGVLYHEEDWVMWDAEGRLVLAADIADLGFAGAAIRGPNQPAFYGNDLAVALDNSTGGDGVWTRSGLDAAAYRPGLQFQRGLIEKDVTGTPPIPGRPAHIVDHRTATMDATAQSYVAGTFMEPSPSKPNRWVIKQLPL